MQDAFSELFSPCPVLTLQHSFPWTLGSLLTRCGGTEDTGKSHTAIPVPGSLLRVLWSPGGLTGKTGLQIHPLSFSDTAAALGLITKLKLCVLGPLWGPARQRSSLPALTPHLGCYGKSVLMVPP